MKRFRAFLAFVLATLALGLPACGSGGGDDDATPTAPGILRAVAIQGQGAVGAPGAVYTVLPTHPLMDADASGWVAFVAPTSDGTRTSVLDAMAPDGTVIGVFFVGQAAPGLVDGTISGFTGVWVGDGFLFAGVTITGNTAGKTFGLVSALLSPGGASDRVGVLYDGDAIPTTAETVADIDTLTPVLDLGQQLWFLVEGAPSGNDHLLGVLRDGSGLTVRALGASTLTAGVSLVAVEAFSVDPTGLFYAIVALTSAADRRIYLRNSGLPTWTEVMRESDTIPTTAEQVAEMHLGGTLSVYNNPAPSGGGRQARVVWLARSNGAPPNGVFLTGDADTGAGGVILLARSGDTAPLAGSGMFGNLLGLNLRPATTIPQFGAEVNASANGVTFGTYGLAGGPPPVLATDNISLTTAGTMGSVYVGLAPSARAYYEVSQNGSFLFANILANGLSAILWLIPGERIYALAVQGTGTPDGDTFGSFASTSAHTVDDGVALFRAPLDAAGSGLYRRGP